MKFNYSVTENNKNTIIQKIEVREGSNGDYYILNDIPYDIHFPIEWALNPYTDCPTEETKEVDPYNLGEGGPEFCNNCMDYGFCNGVFIGYCENCIKHFFPRRDGKGITENYEECENEKADSIWNTYLYSLCPQDIGDAELNKKHKKFCLQQGWRNDYRNLFEVVKSKRD